MVNMETPMLFLCCLLFLYQPTKQTPKNITSQQQSNNSIEYAKLKFIRFWWNEFSIWIHLQFNLNIRKNPFQIMEKITKKKWLEKKNINERKAFIIFFYFESTAKGFLLFNGHCMNNTQQESIKVLLWWAMFVVVGKQQKASPRNWKRWIEQNGDELAGFL